MKDYYENERFSLLNLLGGEYSDIRFVDCEFRNCTFSELKLNNVHFSDCAFACCHAASLEFKNSSFTDTLLSDCRIYGINWGELMAAGAFSEPIREMSGCKIRGGIFEKMSLRKFKFKTNSLLECLFAECDLRESSFINCDLDKTEFLKCDLRNTNFRGARGYAPDIFSCKMKGAAFSSPEALSLLRALEIELD